MILDVVLDYKTTQHLVFLYGYATRCSVGISLYGRTITSNDRPKVIHKRA